MTLRPPLKYGINIVFKAPINATEEEKANPLMIECDTLIFSNAKKVDLKSVIVEGANIGGIETGLKAGIAFITPEAETFNAYEMLGHTSNNSLTLSASESTVFPNFKLVVAGNNSFPLYGNICAGTFYYKLTEINKNDGVYQYDDSIYYVEVKTEEIVEGSTTSINVESVKYLKY